MTVPLLGSQIPTHRLVPAYTDSMGDDAIAVAAIAGLHLDEWQEQYVRDQLGMDANGLWTAPTGEIELSRRNGKTLVLHVMALTFIFLLRARNVVWTTHRGDSALKAFAEMREIILRTPDFRRELLRPPIRTNGKEGFDFRYGGELRFKTRVDGGGRSLEADLLIFDEDQNLNEDEEASLTPLTATNPTAMTLYAGSAGGPKSTVKARLVRDSERKQPLLLAYRWAASEDDEPSDPATIARVNPALGRRLTLDYLLTQHSRMDLVRFGREWLGIGDYPRPSGEEWVIPKALYEQSIDPLSAAVTRLVFVPEVAHNRQASSISVAGWRPDGSVHVEVLRTAPGTRWVVPEILRLVRRHPTLGVAADLRGPTGSLKGTLTDDLKDLGVTLTELGHADITAAYGTLVDAWTTPPATIRHRGPSVLAQALAVASTRRVGGATTWSRLSPGEVHPLLGVTWAAYALQMLSRTPTPPAPVSTRTGMGPRRSETADLATARF